MKRVLLTTGGTGGHIFPALAVAEELKERYPSLRILFLGSKRGPEGDLAQNAGLEFIGLPVEGVIGRGLKGIRAMFKLAVAVIRAVGVMGRFRPQVVVGFGGYASFPGVLAAWLTRRPALLQEQNSVPGVSNKLLAKFVKRVCCGFEAAKTSFPEHKAVFTGNPVRADIRAMGRKMLTGNGGELETAGPEGAQAKPAMLTRCDQVAGLGGRLLVLGGSQGAKAVNSAVLDMLDRLLERGVDILHQAGRMDLERVRQGYEARGVVPNPVVPFIEDMAQAYQWADLILCRAGAATVAEAAVAGKGCLFIPFPFATHNHQVANAAYLVEAGAAAMVEEKDLATVDLGGMVLDILGDGERLQTMSHKARQMGRPEAAAAVVAEMERVIPDAANKDGEENQASQEDPEDTI
ncbi:MAG: undecaprenyldiphospho-muramoylpentapeptide beta-N-acetylglucosaminyltransferase [Desulfovibrio sp.]|nr:MAG: undecaprenyldiphospho-muramoylpentapeptide beta-N-acetylglucosaminyltransferase [Desulfovibrio sp.]